ncbi:MAG: type IX secretion system outer membrane channel protein PorV [Bacteroidia bacterium]
MKSSIIQKIALLSIPIFAVSQSAIAGSGGNANLLGQNLAANVNVVTTAVPFLLIGPDARAGAMGDAGAASTPDAYSTHWNPSKLAFLPDSDKMGFSVSYAPWLRQLVPDINLSYISFYYKLPNQQTIGSSLRYFSLGDIQFTDNNGVETGDFNPYEMALDLSYARQLSDNFSAGMTVRYIYSNLTGAMAVGGEYTKPGQSMGVDLSSYYRSKELEIGGKKSIIAAGICISNIGPSISYSNSGVTNFLPINLRLGPSLVMNLDKYNKLSFILDLNKLLVPTPPDYLQSKTGSGDSMKNGQPVILAGLDPNVGVAQGMIQSFYDAPGGSLEEFHEIDWCGGMEYTYDNQFSARGGFFYENPTKGGREYFTMGAGFRLTTLYIDAAYLIPISQNNPLQNTLRISLGFNFGKSKGSKAPADAE